MREMNLHLFRRSAEDRMIEITEEPIEVWKVIRSARHQTSRFLIHWRLHTIIYERGAVSKSLHRNFGRRDAPGARS